MSKTALDRFRLRRDATLAQNQALFDYHQKRTGPKLMKILQPTALKLLDYDVYSKLAACNWKVQPCRLLGCPVCFRKVRKKAIRDTLKLIGTACGGNLPDPEHLSCVSINWPVEGLTPDTIRRHQHRFRARLSRVWRTELQDTDWHGWLDVDLNGKLHIHLFILHLKRSRTSLDQVLKKAFPATCAVDVGWKRKISVEENLKRWSQYVMGADKHVKRRKGRTLVDQNTPARIALRIVMLERMARKGNAEMRLTLGFKGKWCGDVLRDSNTGIPLVLPAFGNVVATRRPRVNRKWNRHNNLIRIHGQSDPLADAGSGTSLEIGDPSCSRPFGTESPPEPTRTALAIRDRVRAKHGNRVDLANPPESKPPPTSIGVQSIVKEPK